MAAPSLVDVTKTSGVDFVHFNGMTGRLYYAETVGAGGALLDYDNDGDLDLFLVQGHLLGGDRQLSDALIAWPEGQPLRDRLFRNDHHARAAAEPARPAAAGLHFTDVTETSGISSTGYGIGASAADVDNDGDIDLYVLNFGRNTLWLNQGDGTFVEATKDTGVDDPSFSVAASFTDVDQDHRLDLYVANYVNFSLVTTKQCLTARGEKDYCGPGAFKPQADSLFINQATGTFRNQSARLPVPAGAGMGVLSADFDTNGSVDYYVANDLNPNQMLLSTLAKDGPTFSDEALLYGTALNKDGEAEASMGLDAADFDGDGDLDLFATHFRRESNTLYVREESGFYSDQSARFGLAQPSWPRTAFGTRFTDLDSDGDLDLVVANGAVTLQPGDDRDKDPYPLGEPNQFFRNDGGRYVDASSTVPALSGGIPSVSRSVLTGDLDNDGDTDLVITNNSGAVQVLVNNWEREAAGTWLGLDVRLAAKHGGRPALGATVMFDADPPAVRAAKQQRPPRIVRVHNDGGYASAVDHRILRRINTTDQTAQHLRFAVAWPDGKRENFAIPIGPDTVARYHRIVQGTGAAVKPVATP